jgi:Domain of unknown function (DUF4411)
MVQSGLRRSTVPLAAIPGALIPGEALADTAERLSRKFKASTLVILRRLYDAGTLSWDEYRSAYDAEFLRLSALLLERRVSGGGNFYNTQPTRFGRRFTRALELQYTVVTHEVVANTTRRIKIPNACLGMKIRYVTPFAMLRAEKARFVLLSPPIPQAA